MTELSSIQLENEHLKKLQNEMLNLLIELDRICTKHNIPYFLSDGTLLGAIRHQGFIPWDDDIDIQMMRPDYERFCAICETELDQSQFFLQTQRTDSHYNWVYGKLRLRNTRYVRTGQEHLQQQDGIFMDIFPLDEITENPDKQKRILKICKMCRKMLWAPVGKRSAKSWGWRIWFSVVSLIPRSWLIVLFEAAVRSGRQANSRLIASHNLSGHLFQKAWFDDSIRVEFAGHWFRAPASYSNILSSVYGNYMQLPPVEQRKGHCTASFIMFIDGTVLTSQKGTIE